MIAIEQKPKYQLISAQSPIIFTVFDGPTIASKVKVKYVADIRVSNQVSGLGTSVAKVKVSPNDTGRGIFDFSPIVHNFVSPDFLGGVVHNSNSNNSSSYNTVQFSDSTPHSIHQIDKFSTNRRSCRFLRIEFSVEGAGTITDAVVDQGTTETSLDYVIYNGILDTTDILNIDNSGDFGYNIDHAGFILNDTDGKFLTNAPTTQYIRDNDYQTLAFFSQYDEDFVVGAGGTHPSISKIKIEFFDSSGSTLSTINRTVSANNGGHAGNMNDSNTRLQFVGVGPGNITGAGSTVPATWSYYTVQAIALDSGSSDTVVSKTYTFEKMSDDCKGYENIRLTWINKYGTWDYYNFNKKSVRTLISDRVQYTQLEGTWNESKFKLHDHLGGTKMYRNKVSENISINTDYITETEASWLSDLFMSTDVYIVNRRSPDSSDEGYNRKYITPVILTTSDYIKKTVANDKLIQYNIELTVSRNRQTMKV